MRRVTHRFIAATLCLAALAGGCGSEDPQPEGAKPEATKTPAAAQTPAAPTREEVIAKGDDLCRRLNVKAKAANRKAADIIRTGTSNEQVLGDLAPVLASSYKAQAAFTERFKALEAPADDGGKLARIQRGVQRQLANLGELRDAAKARDLEAYTAAAKRSEQIVKPNRRAVKAYGFRECGSGKADAE